MACYNGMHTHAGALPGAQRTSNAVFFRRAIRSMNAPRHSGGSHRTAAVMMPVGVPRVPYRGPNKQWQWVDIWNCLYRERIVFIGKGAFLIVCHVPHASLHFSAIPSAHDKHGCRTCTFQRSYDGPGVPHCNTYTRSLRAARTHTWPHTHSHRAAALTTEHAGVDDELGNQLVATLLYLDSENKKPINIYLNTSGGDVVPCLALYDTFKHIKSEVHTVGFGGVMGMAGFLLACGARYIAGRQNAAQQLCKVVACAASARNSTRTCARNPAWRSAGLRDVAHRRPPRRRVVACLA